MIKLGLHISIQLLSDATTLTPLMCASHHYLHSGTNQPHTSDGYKWIYRHLNVFFCFESRKC